MLSAPELGGQCEEHWPSVFGYDRREIFYKDILSLSLPRVHIGVYAIYDIYVFLFVCVLSKGCNNQAYGLHLAWLEWIRT